ncbi:MAG TPA: type I restriction enzyme HsdR N-terminal domain-containing protein [Thermoanaerobaculia bacterium]|jgi:hypothetical protein|nr:type I restriction enzyme HsdR N-terminal domain-containing protein [Thermoanaerobaculia bacterium]
MSRLPGLNEETVKNRFVLPYIESLGFSRDEIQFEEPVSLRVGRTTHRLTPLAGRLDILVKSGERNLILVEIKAEGLELTDADRDQAISYALAVQPFAPVVLLSNGQQHRLFESITRREITSADEIRKGQVVYHVATPPDFQAAYEEAITYFLGCSVENLLTFCRQQTAESMASLKGSATDRTKKYLPELFVARQALLDDVAAFRASGQPLLAVVAEAGAGKTCCLCSLADALVAVGEPVLFYRGLTLPGPILPTVASDFSWTFAEERSAPHLVRRIDKLLGDRSLVIMIDAVDEWEHPMRIQDLLATARHLSGHRIKLIVSCKTSVWSEFLTGRGTPTGLADLCFSPREGQPYCLLPAMNPHEFLATVEGYKAFYGVSGGFEEAAWRAAQENLFLLRILFEVAERQRAEHLTFSSLEFFDHYYDQALAVLNDQRRGADRLLCAAARLLYESGQERVYVEDLARAMHGSDIDRLLVQLLRLRLLESSRTPAGEQVSFYFSPLRDYLVAFRVRRWQELPDADLASALGAVGDADVRLEALTFFYRHCTDRQRRLVDAPFFSHAREFTCFYDRVLRTDFPRLRKRFPPYTLGDIGFVGELDLRHRQVDDYGFRAREGNAEEVLFLPSARSDLSRRSNLAILYGARALHWSSNFSAPDVTSEVLRSEIGRPLRQLIDLGDLDESTCPELASEVVATLVAANRGIFSDTRHAASAGTLFPIHLADVRRWLRFELLRRHFDSLRQEENVRSGEIPVTRHENGGISYDWAPSLEDLTWIEQQIEAHLHDSEREVRQKVARSLDIGLKAIDRRLLAAIETLEAHGITSIANLPFEGATDLWNRMWQRRLRMEEIVNFLERLLPFVFRTFRRLVAHNFPTMAGDFFSIARQPLLGVGQVDLHHAEPVWWHATLFLCQPDPGMTEDRFVFRERSSAETRIIRDPSFRFEVRLDGDWRLRLETRDQPAGLVQRGLRLASVFHPSYDYLERHQFQAPGPVQPVLRGLVYDLVRTELPPAFAALCRRYDVELSNSDWNFFGRARN